MTPAPTPTPNLAPADLWLDKARAGGDADFGAFLIVLALVLVAVFVLPRLRGQEAKQAADGCDE